MSPCWFEVGVWPFIPWDTDLSAGRFSITVYIYTVLIKPPRFWVCYAVFMSHCLDHNYKQQKRNCPVNVCCVSSPRDVSTSCRKYDHNWQHICISTKSKINTTTSVWDCTVNRATQCLHPVSPLNTLLKMWDTEGNQDCGRETQWYRMKNRLLKHLNWCNIFSATAYCYRTFPWMKLSVVVDLTGDIFDICIISHNMSLANGNQLPWEGGGDLRKSRAHLVAIQGQPLGERSPESPTVEDFWHMTLLGCCNVIQNSLNE